MGTPPRAVSIHHFTSQPYRFFGRTAELALLDLALDERPGEAKPSVVALLGPGGQGKTAIVQHWLEPYIQGARSVEGVFLWSFYRGKDADLCLRELYTAVANLVHLPPASASYCVDRLSPLLRSQKWVVVLDGAEVVQYESGPWLGRFIHPDLGRLVEELGSAWQPGVVVLTTRFPLPELERRPCTRLVVLGSLDPASARGLLGSLGVRGSETELDEAAVGCGLHAKAVELLGTYLGRFHRGEATRHRSLPEPPPPPDSSDEERRVARVLAAFQAALPVESQDILSLATAFRDPPSERRLLEYLASTPVRTLLHETWGRTYLPFGDRPPGWPAEQVEDLVQLRLLERVGLTATERTAPDEPRVIDAHPLVRRSFEHVLGSGGRRQGAQARAGFLHGRPDRRRAASLEEAREEVELLHAYCDSGLWQEAEATLAGLDRPRYRFLAPALERDLLLRFFPEGDWRLPPLWPRFDRYRDLAICLEMLGCFKDALAVYREAEAALRGDALIALGHLAPLMAPTRPPHPWQMLWQAYRCHALCLAGDTAAAVATASALVPVDVYEWTHVFECLLRMSRLTTLDMRSFLYRPPHGGEHRWNDLARQRMRADYLRVTAPMPAADLAETYRNLIEEYDRGGLPYERGLARLGYAGLLLGLGDVPRARTVNDVTRDLAKRHAMRIMEADAWHLEAAIARQLREPARVEQAETMAARLRRETGYHGPERP